MFYFILSYILHIAFLYDVSKRNIIKHWLDQNTIKAWGIEKRLISSIHVKSVASEATLAEIAKIFTFFPIQNNTECRCGYCTLKSFIMSNSPFLHRKIALELYSNMILFTPCKYVKLRLEQGRHNLWIWCIQMNRSID